MWKSSMSMSPYYRKGDQTMSYKPPTSKERIAQEKSNSLAKPQEKRCEDCDDMKVFNQSDIGCPILVKCKKDKKIKAAGQFCDNK